MKKKNLKANTKIGKSKIRLKEKLTHNDSEASNQSVSDEMTRIIFEYKEQNKIPCITEEELTDIFGDSFLPPDQYYPYGEGFAVEITYHDAYMLNQGINPFEGWEYRVIQEYLDEILQTEDGIDLGNADQLSENDEFEDAFDDYYREYRLLDDFPQISEEHFWKQYEKDIEIEMMKELFELGDTDCLDEGEWERSLEEELEYNLSLRTKTVVVYVTDVYEVMHWVSNGMEETTYCLKIHWDEGERKFLIKVSDEWQCLFYQVILEFDYNKSTSFIYLGDTYSPDSVLGIIDSYINGECLYETACAMEESISNNDNSKIED
jgi:hypothetical protein